MSLSKHLNLLCLLNQDLAIFREGAQTKKNKGGFLEREIHSRLMSACILARVIRFIISMTKLLDADWLRGVQLFH